MSKSNSYKLLNTKALSPPSNNKPNDVTPKKKLIQKKISANSNSEQLGIIEVYEDNFIQEIKNLSNLLEEYNYIGMDTEFPGTVFYVQNMTKDFYYKTLKLNVDNLKLIQLGVTLTNSKGEFPKNYPYHTWQFNLEFDKNKDQISPSSLSLLEESGIDFEKLKNKGIKHKLFAEYFMISGLVLNPEIRWISFHGSYDFGYLLKLLLNSNLPETEKDFMTSLNAYFINYYDIRTLVKGKEQLQGSLNKLAQYLEVQREGKNHQAGSDSVVTIDVYFKLIKNGEIEENTIVKNKNILFGVLSEEDNKETINYSQFGNLMYQNNNTNNLLCLPMNFSYNMQYYYMMNGMGNNHTTQTQTQIPNKSATQVAAFV